MAQAKPQDEARTSDREGDPGQGEGRGGRQTEAMSNLAQTTMRSFGQWCDLHAATARVVLRAQLRAAAAFGLPNWASLFELADDRSLRLFSASTDNAVRFAGRMNDTSAEIQGYVIRLLEQQAIDFSERWGYGLEELQRQTAESLEQLKALSRQQADEMARATESLSDATRASLREGGEQFRATVRQGMQFSRDIAERQNDVMNTEGRQMGEAARGAAGRMEGEAAGTAGRPMRASRSA
ncbi:MAG TPA: hypothetical protein VJ673_01960 [Aromatoleum sp.]|uniref:hypothetical protein n=1 Tax=Aromatoleum sp. TaxID=2307007 RepID=UPI002B4A545B|nr:hypothetical protein [Aromatoleum sp.]HJV24414.1 hypothetical protein [Aromatoleum sp.]